MANQSNNLWSGWITLSTIYFGSDRLTLECLIAWGGSGLWGSWPPRIGRGDGRPLLNQYFLINFNLMVKLKIHNDYVKKLSKCLWIDHFVIETCHVNL